jgi:hypothetical protein
MPRARLSLLLKHFSQLDDAREPWRILYPLHEVLLLVTCATIASCDDFDDIVAWGQHHLAFLRRFSEFYHGIPCERCAASSIGSIQPCSAAASKIGLSVWRALSPLRRSWVRRDVLPSIDEITAIPDLLDQLAGSEQLEDALVTIDAIGCQVEIADKIVAHKADYLLASKAISRHSKLMSRIISALLPPPRPSPKPPSRKAMAASKRAPIRLPALSIGSSAIEATPGSRALRTSRPCSRSTPAPNTSIAAASTHVTISLRRPSTSNASPEARAAIGASRACTGCSMSSSRTTCRCYRTGHGSNNMAIVSRFALGLVRANNSKGSVKTRRKPQAGARTFCSKSFSSIEC